MHGHGATACAPSDRIRRGKMWAAAHNFSCGVRKRSSPPRIAVRALPEPAIQTAAAGARIPAQPPCRSAGRGRGQRPAPVLRHRRSRPVRDSVLLGALTATCSVQDRASVPVPSATLTPEPPGAFPARCARSVHRFGRFEDLDGRGQPVDGCLVDTLLGGVATFVVGHRRANQLVHAYEQRQADGPGSALEVTFRQRVVELVERLPSWWCGAFARRACRRSARG